MNLRRILQGVALFCLVALSTNMASAQTTQLAGVNQDGLIQLGSNHPFVVSTYEIDISAYGIGSPQDAADFFRKYIEEGFSFTYNFSDGKAFLNLDLQNLSQYTGDAIEVSRMNEKLRAVHRIRR